MVLRLSIYSSQSHWWYSDYPYTHHSLPGDTQTILVFITAALVVLGLSLYSSQSVWWSSVYPYPQDFLFGGTQSIPVQSLITVYLVAQTIPILITVSLVVPRLSLYSSQFAWWYSDYPYTHHSLPGGTQTIPIPITVSLVILRQFITAALAVLRLSLYTSQSPWWYSKYPYKHHSLPFGTQTIPIDITAFLIAQRHFT